MNWEIKPASLQSSAAEFKGLWTLLSCKPNLFPPKIVPGQHSQAQSYLAWHSILTYLLDASPISQPQRSYFPLNLGNQSQLPLKLEGINYTTRKTPRVYRARWSVTLNEYWYDGSLTPTPNINPFSLAWLMMREGVKQLMRFWTTYFLRYVITGSTPLHLHYARSRKWFFQGLNLSLSGRDEFQSLVRSAFKTNNSAATCMMWIRTNSHANLYGEL